MDLLLDTHILLWFINGDKQLPAKIVETIKDIENKCFVSIVTIWEIVLKLSQDKLVIKGGFSVIENFIEDNDIEVIPITFEHTKRLLGLEFLHRDPFDRMIIAQSICENLIIVTKDSVFTGYKIKILW